MSVTFKGSGESLQAAFATIETVMYRPGRFSFVDPCVLCWCCDCVDIGSTS